MNYKNYVKNLSKEPLQVLMIKSLMYDRENNLLTNEQIGEIVKEINILFPPQTENKDLSQTPNYLFDVEQRATPESCKRAKKSKESYMEYLIYKDRESGEITPIEAKQAKDMLPAFLNQNKTVENES